MGVFNACHSVAPPGTRMTRFDQSFPVEAELSQESLSGVSIIAYINEQMEDRKHLFNVLYFFTVQLPIRYFCAKVNKAECSDDIQQTAKLSRAITTELQAHLDYWSSFDKEKLETVIEEIRGRFGKYAIQPACLCLDTMSEFYVD